MTPLHTKQQQKKTMCSHCNLQRAAGMDASNRKVLALVFTLLLSQLTCDAHSVSECCRQTSHSCRLYALLCRSGGNALAGDAAAGILTLGKRGEEEHRLHSRLHQLLQVSRNQAAAGLLTMGKRTEENAGEPYMDWMARSGVTMPLPV